MPSINSMIPDQNRPPAQPGVSLEPSTTQASAGSTPAGPQPQSPQSNDSTKLLSQAGQLFSQGGVGSPVVNAPIAPTGDSTNVISGGGMTSAGPAAGMGPGTGLVTKPGTIGQTKARQRPMQGGFLSQGRK